MITSQTKQTTPVPISSTEIVGLMKLYSSTGIKEGLIKPATIKINAIIVAINSVLNFASKRRKSINILSPQYMIVIYQVFLSQHYHLFP